MGQNGTDSITPQSLAPETDAIDSSWDDDDPVSGVEFSSPEAPTTPGVRALAAPALPELEDELSFEDLNDDGDRVTAIPDVPAELLARELMSRAPQSAPPVEQTAPSLHDRETPTGPVAPGRAPSLELPFTSPSTPKFAPIDDLDLAPPDPTADALPLPTVEPPPAPDSYVEMKDRYATGDFTGALIVAESLLETQPEDEQALRYASSCREVLTQMYAARLGPLTQLVTVGVAPDQIRWLSLDHRAGFLLSMVDGTSTIEEILDISGMPRLDALRILFTLLEQQVIVLAPGEA